MIAGIILYASLFWSASAPQKEIMIDGEVRPSQVLRSYSGLCDAHRYEISIWPGRAIFEAIQDVKIDGRSVLSHVRSAAGQTDGETIDALVSQCLPDGAEITFEVSEPTDRTTLHFYYLHVGKDGQTTFLGER